MPRGVAESSAGRHQLIATTLAAILQEAPPSSWSDPLEDTFADPFPVISTVGAEISTERFPVSLTAPVASSSFDAAPAASEIEIFSAPI